MKMVGFERGRNPGTKTCAMCGKRTWVSKGGSTDLCEPCFDEAGLENEHSDGHHVARPNPDCRECRDA